VSGLSGESAPNGESSVRPPLPTKGNDGPGVRGVRGEGGAIAAFGAALVLALVLIVWDPLGVRGSVGRGVPACGGRVKAIEPLGNCRLQLHFKREQNKWASLLDLP
jgi:hypothetical protein